MQYSIFNDIKLDIDGGIIERREAKKKLKYFIKKLIDY